MKKFLIIYCFCFFGNSIKAQDITGVVIGTNFSYQTINTSQYNFTFQTYFSLGYQDTCPQLINMEFVVDNNTLYVKGFYDITGNWPAAGCQSLNTAQYNNTLPANVTQIIMSTNVIGYNNTPPYTPSIITYENVYTRTFDLNLSLPNNLNTSNILVYPNPTKDKLNISSKINYDKMTLTNNLGQIIYTLDKNLSGSYDLQNLKSGIYYLSFYSENKKIGVQKLIKEN